MSASEQPSGSEPSSVPSPGYDAAQYWNEAAAGWIRHRERLRAYTEPISRRLVELLDPQPRQRVLELAAGLAESGLLAAPRLGREGLLIVSDRSQAMLDAARERAAELGVENVEFKLLDVEWIDLPVASVDAVLCRFGYMLATEPASALRETRRVIAPGGRLAFAVWDAIERNPWSLVPSTVARERGILPPPAAGAPGPFALGDADRLRAMVEEAGFLEVQLEALDLEEVHPDFDSYWERRLDLSRALHDAVLSQRQQQIAEIRAEVASRLAPFTSREGQLRIPARTLVAAASA
jgi:SAM-dependent methyltransferase